MGQPGSKSLEIGQCVACFQHAIAIADLALLATGQTCRILGRPAAIPLLFLNHQGFIASPVARPDARIVDSGLIPGIEPTVNSPLSLLTILTLKRLIHHYVRHCG